MTVHQAYAALGVDGATATPESVRTAFHQLVLHNHPDTVTDPQAKREATETMVRLNEAYQMLKSAGFPKYIKPADHPHPVWQPQRDSGDEEFERWLHDLNFNAYQDRERRESFHWLSPLDQAVFVPVAIAVFAAIAFWLSGAFDTLMTRMHWSGAGSTNASGVSAASAPDLNLLIVTGLVVAGVVYTIRQIFSRR